MQWYILLTLVLRFLGNADLNCGPSAPGTGVYLARAVAKPLPVISQHRVLTLYVLLSEMNNNTVTYRV